MTAREKWVVGTTLALQVVRSKRRLFVGLTQVPEAPGVWSVMALETDVGSDVQGVLDQHSHEYLGKFTLGKAITTAQAYAAKWRPSKSASCACDEIKPSRRRKPTTFLRSDGTWANATPENILDDVQTIPRRGNAHRQAQARRTRR